MSGSPDFVLLPEHTLKGECDWVAIHNKKLPRNAHIGGLNKNGEPMYVARLRYGGECLPGYVLKSTGLCYACSGGKLCRKESFEVLVSNSPNEFQWVAAANGDLADGAVVGGLATGDELLYVGRVKLERGYRVGKIQPSRRGCIVVLNDVQMTFPEYGVLTCREPAHLKNY